MTRQLNSLAATTTYFGALGWILGMSRWYRIEFTAPLHEAPGH